MKDIPFIQCVVASICRVRVESGKGYVEQLHGTGFYVSKNGHLLTARHVIEKGQADISKNGGFLCMFPKADDGLKSLCHPIKMHEFAPEPFDVAICTTDQPSRTFYRVAPTEVGVWRDIGAIGYPMATVKSTVTTYEVHTRFHKGYIQRVLKPGDLIIGHNPPAFEVNFPITQGLSGGPLFIYNQQHDFLIGICVGSIESRVVAYESVAVEDNEKTYKEQVAKIEEFGIAHSTIALADWRPSLLQGKSLKELSDEAWKG